MFDRPEFPVEPERGALRVAVAVAPDLRLDARRADERVVGGHRAVAVQPYHRAIVSRLILREIRVAAVADGQEQVAVRAFHDPRAEMLAAAAARRHLEQHPHIFERVASLRQPADGERRPGAPVLRLGKGQEHVPAGLEIARRLDVEQPALPARPDLGHARHLDARAIRREMPQIPVALGDEKAAAGQEGEAPGFAQPVGHHVDPERADARVDRAGRKRRGGEQNGRSNGSQRNAEGGKLDHTAKLARN